MRCIVVGLGVQGPKRIEAAGTDAVATVDPVKEGADFTRVEDVPLDRYDAALVCTPDDTKLPLLTYLLGHGKHVLVEKPLFADSQDELERLKALAGKTGATCYTAYNHRFEPHFANMKRVLDSGELGEVYRCRMFYGNGTARLVRNSAWRDQGAGVLPDLGSHLLDTLLFWFERPDYDFRIVSADRFENRAFDHVVVGGTPQNGRGPRFELEMTLLSWRNHHTTDIFAEKGSAHIESLCKWGPSTLTVRDRKVPSGRPDERAETLVQPDPTWKLEYAHFKSLCGTGRGNLDADLWLNRQLKALADEALSRHPAQPAGAA